MCAHLAPLRQRLLAVKKKNNYVAHEDPHAAASASLPTENESECARSNKKKINNN